MRTHLFVILLVAFVSCPVALAQDLADDDRPVCEVALSTSYTAYMIGAVGGGFTGIPFMADFRIAAGRWVAFGVTGGFHLGSSKSFWKQFNIKANLYGTWYNGEKFRVYSGIGYGNAAGWMYFPVRLGVGWRF